MSTTPPDDRSRTVTQPADGPTRDPTHPTAEPATLVAGHDTPPAQALESVASPARRVLIQGYEVRGQIAQGGMGVVFAARDPTLGRDVAIKTLLLDRADAESVRRFEDEARITARLPHPAIPPVHALGTLPDGRPFLAMKLIRGHTLAELLRERPAAADLPRLVGIFEAVCQGVAFAHSQGVVHRDLKPANVMVGAFGEVQVMDWGIAKEYQTAAADGPGGVSGPVGEPDQTGTCGAIGTPAYMAPEQARGEPVGPQADVFALGGILATILTGEPPYTGKDPAEVFARAASADLSGAIARLDACGAEVAAIARRCLSPDPAGRPPDAGEVAGLVAGYRAGVEERLRQAEQDRAVAAAEAREQRKRFRLRLALAGAVLLLVAGGGAFAWWRDRQAAEQSLADERRTSAEFRAEAEAQKARAEAENARSGVHALLAASADLRRRYQFEDAAVPLGQAELLTAKGAADLRPVVERAKADLAFARRLDDIRMKRGTWIGEPGGKGHFDLAGAVRDYPEAFRAAGLDVLGADPGVVAAAVAASPVRAELIAALDDWAALPLDESIRDRILGVLRRADPGPWLDRFRDPAIRADPVRLWWLARSADPARLPPATLTALSEVMEARGLDPVLLLLRAQFAHPGDFLIPFQLGQWHHSRKEHDATIAHYRSARVTRPGNLAVLTNLGATLKATGDTDGAIAAYKEAIKRDPRFARAHNNLGIALKDGGDVDGAIAAFSEAIKHDPMYANAHYNLGVALMARGDPDGAIAAYKEAIKHDPRFARAHYNLGIALYGKGDPDGAIAAYNEAIKHDPKDARAHNNLGIALKDKGDPDGAITAYKEAIRHDPKDANAHNNLGVALYGKGDPDGAIAAYKEAIKHDPRLARAHYNLGIALYGKGDPEGAIAAYNEAIKLDPKDANAHFNLGVALMARGDPEGAIAAYKEAIRHDPKDARAHTNLGVALKDRDLDGAIAAYREAIRHDPKDANAHYNLGIALKDKGDVDGAIAAYKEAIRHDPKDARAHTNLGVVFLDQKKYPEAITCARAATQADPKLSNAHAMLGELLQRTGDLPGARAALTEAARLDSRWKPMLANLPPVPVAPSPRPVPPRP
jgi:tetratricopeptide (TPR) repeat protein